LNLASACPAEDASVLWGFIKRYLPDATPSTHPFLDRLVGYAVRYYHDFIAAHTAFRAPMERERGALEELRDSLNGAFTGSHDAEALQTEIYRIGRERGFEPMREWFSCLYETLLGQAQGPRMGSFIALYGTSGTVRLIEEALQR
jgi:lysyl-tRNA synthetase, class I